MVSRDDGASESDRTSTTEHPSSANSEPRVEPTVSAYSPLFEMRAWRRELDRMMLEYSANQDAMHRILEARRDVDGWIRTRERHQSISR